MDAYVDCKDECCEDPSCIHYTMCGRRSAVLSGNNCERDRDLVLEKRERIREGRIYNTPTHTNNNGERVRERE